MPIKTDKKTLLDALTSLKVNIPPTDMSDVSKYTIFQSGRIHAFNDLSGMTIPFNPEMDDCAVDSMLLYEFVKGIPDKELLMGLAGGVLRVQGANKVGNDIIMAEFPLRADVFYPAELIECDPAEYKMLPETFPTALMYTAFACDEDSAISSRVVIKNGFAYSKGRLAVCEFYLGDDAVDMIDEPMFVSPSAIGFVNRDTPRKYLIKHSWLHLMNEVGVIMSLRTRVEDNFPFDKIKEMLTDPGSTPFRFPASLKDILTRCAPFSGHSAKIRKVNIKIKEGVMALTARRNDGSRFLEKAKAIDTENPIDFSVNLAALTSIIDLADKYATDGFRLIGYGTNFRVMTVLEGRDD